MTERPVLVTTEYRGVFFGYAADTKGDTIILKRARNCIYWPSTNGYGYGYGYAFNSVMAAGAVV